MSFYDDERIRRKNSKYNLSVSEVDRWVEETKEIIEKLEKTSGFAREQLLRDHPKLKEFYKTKKAKDL